MTSFNDYLAKLDESHATLGTLLSSYSVSIILKTATSRCGSILVYALASFSVFTGFSIQSRALMNSKAVRCYTMKFRRHIHVSCGNVNDAGSWSSDLCLRSKFAENIRTANVRNYKRFWNAALSMKKEAVEECVRHSRVPCGGVSQLSFCPCLSIYLLRVSSTGGRTAVFCSQPSGFFSCREGAVAQ